MALKYGIRVIDGIRTLGVQCVQCEQKVQYGWGVRELAAAVIGRAATLERDTLRTLDALAAAGCDHASDAVERGRIVEHVIAQDRATQATA